MKRAQALLVFHIDLLRQQQRGDLKLDDRDVEALSRALTAITETALKDGGDMERAGPQQEGPAPFGS